jgi:uncharacterized protein
MKIIRCQILLILICFTTVSFGQSLPKSIGFVNDFENIFTDKQEQVLDSLIKNFEKETKIQIAIVTLDSSYTNKSDFDNYTLKLANNWGVGQKDKDNGLLIGISSSLRKMRIQNGYGIKKILSDQETQVLIDSLFIPNFKQDKYFDGTKKGVTGIINTLERNSRTLQVDSMMILMEKLIKEWDPEKEPWTFISIDIVELNLTINYGQQTIHPYLAEYNRKIQFITKNSKTDTLNMAINSGGRTLIEVYYNKDKNIIIMEDNFGGYYFDLATLEYSEKLWDKFEKYDNKEYLGTINGKEHPLEFIRKKE